MTPYSVARPSHSSPKSHVVSRFLLPLVLLGLLTACDHRVASEKSIDVCALALDSASTLLQEMPTSKGVAQPPSAGYCEFTSQPGPNRRRSISISVMTKASMEPDDLSRSAKLMLAEAEQTYGDPGTSEFGDLAKLGVAFHAAPGNAQQVIVGERGVVMEIGLGSGGFSDEQVATFVTDVWSRVLASKPTKR